MHIEPGLVHGTKIMLSYATAAGVLATTVVFSLKTSKQCGFMSLLGRSLLATLLVFCCFEVLPHKPIGISELHLIVGSTLFLLFGPAAAAIGLAGGLLVQGLFFAPFDLPQYGMNVTTLLAPLFAMQLLAKRIIAPNTAYVDLRYSQVLRLSLAYQGGVVAWVAFWAILGQGMGSANLMAIASFGASYLLIIMVEPLIDLTVLAIAKALPGQLQNLQNSGLFEQRLYHAHAA